MKKYLILFTIILSTESSIAQCPIPFDVLDKSTNLTFSSFDTFALKNGYTFNSEENIFFCDIEFKKNANQMLIRSQTETGYNLIQHSFFSKQSYLDYKEILENKGELNGTNTSNNTLTLIYTYDKRLVTLQTKTVISTTLYFITFSNEKLRE